ncbi:MAG TPA: AAA family ATPase, partial [Miltoncostaea sp.]|nr:AAA family ATPase [Miltoncostaea sp.]
MTGRALQGRERELAVLDGLLTSIGLRGGAVVLRGDPGVGKSALLSAVRRGARRRGLRTLTATGVQSEARLAFAGLHQLLRPVMADLAALPPHQGAALDAAFGGTDTEAPSRFVIALAALDLLSEAAGRSPTVVLVDDAHWLDRPTCEVLAFVARRVESESLVMAIAIRDGYESPLLDAGLQELTVEALGDADARAVLDARFPALPSPLRERVLADAQGNPLALDELPTAPMSGDRRDGLPTIMPPLTARLERTFAQRCAELPEPTRRLLLIAALEDGGALHTVTAALARFDGGTAAASAVAPAVAARLIEVDGFELRFRHPLVRSAIQGAASGEERRTAHAALAAVLAGQPDRQVWHRAASVAAPDEAIARELEAAAERAQRRGAMPVAISALERAGMLSEGPSGKSRFLRAAELAFEIGRQDLVARLLDRVGPGDLDGRERARVALIRESPADGVHGDPVRVRLAVETAVEMDRAGDTDLALALLLDAALRCWWADPGVESRDRVVAAAEALAVDATDPRLLAILATAAPVRRGEVVLDRLASVPAAAVEAPGAAPLLGVAAQAAGDPASSYTLLTGAIAGLRAQGRLGLLAQFLGVQTWNAIAVGNWNAAEPLAEEWNRLSPDAGQRMGTTGSQVAIALLLGVRGDRERAMALGDEAERVLLPAGLGILLCVLQLARGLTELAAGRHADAYEQLRRGFDPGDPAHHYQLCHWSIAYLAEAAAHCGRVDDARAILASLGPRGAHPTSPG